MTFEFTKKNIILIIVLLFIMFLGLFVVESHNPKSPSKENANNKELVKDYSRFFSISNAADKYISYLGKQDKENLILLLSDQYIKEHKINNDNILNKIDLLDKEYSFEAKKIYQSRINDNIIKYYIYGHLTENAITGYKKPIDYYLIINLDEKTSLYDVTPYDGHIFKEEQ